MKLGTWLLIFATTSISAHKCVKSVAEVQDYRLPFLVWVELVQINTETKRGAALAKIEFLKPLAIVHVFFIDLDS